MNKIELMFAISVVLLMVNNTTFLMAYRDYGIYNIITISSLIVTGFLFIVINLVFSLTVEKLKEKNNQGRKRVPI